MVWRFCAWSTFVPAGSSKSVTLTRVECNGRAGPWDAVAGVLVSGDAEVEDESVTDKVGGSVIKPCWVDDGGFVGGICDCC